MIITRPDVEIECFRYLILVFITVDFHSVNCWYLIQCLHRMLGYVRVYISVDDTCACMRDSRIYHVRIRTHTYAYWSQAVSQLAVLRWATGLQLDNHYHHHCYQQQSLIRKKNSLRSCILFKRIFVVLVKNTCVCVRIFMRPF